MEKTVLAAIAALEYPNNYGVPIAEWIENETGKRVSTGALYTALSRLEDDGFITSYLGELSLERGGRRKKHFNLTTEGKRFLLSQTVSFNELVPCLP